MHMSFTYNDTLMGLEWKQHAYWIPFPSAILIVRQMGNMPVKFDSNPPNDIEGAVIKIFFLFLALVAILFTDAEQFQLFW